MFKSTLTIWGRLLVGLAAWMRVGDAYEEPKIHKKMNNRKIRGPCAEGTIQF